MVNNTDQTIITRKEGVGHRSRMHSTRYANGSSTIQNVVYLFFGLLEILLMFRFVLKLAGASHSSRFVSFVYSFSGAFTWPFEGIFRAFLGQGIETTAVFEPSTLVAIVAYAIIGWGIIKLVVILSGDAE